MEDYRYTAKCNGCEVVAGLHDPMAIYILDDDKCMPVDCCVSFCKSCDTVVWSEDVPTLVEIDKRISELETLDSPELSYFKPLIGKDENIDRALAHAREELDWRVEWRKGRQAPSLCLDCGSAGIVQGVALPVKNGKSAYDIDCPRCSGTIHVIFKSIPPTMRDVSYYSSEGALILQSQHSE